MKTNSSIATAKQNRTKPLVSIVVPVYGVKDFIQKCIDSLVAQSMKEIEIILVDDGSKDGSGQICDQNARLYPKLINVIHQINTGLGGARNTGIKVAGGKYIMFVDSDDYLSPSAVEMAYRSVSQNDVDMAVFGFNFINDKGRILKKVYDGKNFGKILSCQSDTSLILNSPSAWNKIYKTELFSQHNIWFAPRTWHEDIIATLKIYTVATKVIYVHELLYYYVQREGSITHNTNVERNKEILDAFDEIIDYYKSNGLFEKYYDELEYLAILNIYTSASTRVATVDANNKLLPQFKSYLAKHFPKYDQNMYIRNLGLRHKVLYFLIKRDHYRTVKLLSLLRSRVEN